MLSPDIRRILESLSEYKENEEISEDRGPSITINKLAGKAGVLYEKLRYLIDYKEEHTIRRNAIERILKRNLLIGKSEGIGLSLLQELVSGGYLTNREVPEEVANDVQLIVDKYLVLGSDQVENSQLASVMASEIERFLYPQVVNDLVVEAFYSTVSDRIKYRGPISNDELRVQTYIACRRSLLEDDRETLLYAVLVKHIPELPGLNKENAIELVPNFGKAIHAVQSELENPLGWKMSSRLKNYSIYFSVIREIINEHKAAAEAIFSDPGRLEKEIKKILGEKYGRQRKTLNKSGNRAIAYIFLTKMALALALELPYEKIFLSSIDYFALGINVVFHPALLLAMVRTASPPSKDNTILVVSGVQEVIRDEVGVIYVKPSINNPFLLSVFGLFYAILFVVSFGLILWVLSLLNFNVLSVVLFLLFLTLVSYFGFRIRHNSKKMKISADEENLFSLLWSFFTIPIIRTGRWLSRKFSSINIFVFVMDFILETPFKFVLGTFDDFLSFLREKREDPY